MPQGSDAGCAQARGSLEFKGGLEFYQGGYEEGPGVGSQAGGGVAYETGRRPLAVGLEGRRVQDGLTNHAGGCLRLARVKSAGEAPPWLKTEGDDLSVQLFCTQRAGEPEALPAPYPAPVPSKSKCVRPWRISNS